MAGAGVDAEAGLDEERLTDEKLAMHFLRQKEEVTSSFGGSLAKNTVTRLTRQSKSWPRAVDSI